MEDYLDLQYFRSIGVIQIESEDTSSGAAKYSFGTDRKSLPAT